jgi:hypothetical protein
MISRKNKKRIEFSPIFKNKLNKVPLEIKVAFRDSLEIFLEDSHHKSLRNHLLTKEYAGIRSINELTRTFLNSAQQNAENYKNLALSTQPVPRMEHLTAIPHKIRSNL